MNIEKIEAIKDNDISRPGNDFYTILINGETALECVAAKEVGAAISSIMLKPDLFKDIFM